jgi:hypothetical protein
VIPNPAIPTLMITSRPKPKYNRVPTLNRPALIIPNAIETPACPLSANTGIKTSKFC